jgi:hypothetical protein
VQRVVETDRNWMGITYTLKNWIIFYFLIWTNFDILFSLSAFFNLLSANTSGKAGAQIPHPPLQDDSSPWGR